MTAANIVTNLQQVVIDYEPFAELLLDNTTAFRSAAVDQFAKEWDISLRLRAAYASSGTRIIKRNHSKIKWIASRGDISPELATFWHNVTPWKDVDETSDPNAVMFRSPWIFHDKTALQPTAARENVDFPIVDWFMH